MSSREPMWYCHECNAEMRPLMVPDPHCASCNGTFVEKIENPSDDPREFRAVGGSPWEDAPLGEMDPFSAGLFALLSRNPPMRPSPQAESRRSSTDRARSPSDPGTRSQGRDGAFSLRIEHTNRPDGGLRTMVLGGPPSRRNSDDDELPRLSQFAPRNPDGTAQNNANITGPMLAQYLMALLGPAGRGNDPLMNLFGGMFGPSGMPPGGGEPGRWGDYVFNQEALDQIISQLMENTNSHQPVPASEAVIEKLPREVLEDKSPLLEKDCAVCKDQFKLDTEDPDEQVVITLPCHHPFHEPCILPWLKNSGTCPVCRHQLVPQPDAHPQGPPQPSGSDRANTSAAPGGGTSGGLLQNVLSMLGGHQAGQRTSSNSNPSPTNSSTSNNGSQGQGSSSASNRRSSSQQDRPEYDIPGGWGDQID